MSSQTHSDQCSHAYLSSLNLNKEQACEQIGKGICSSGRYVNMYKVYYCTLEQQSFLYFFFMVVFFVYMMFNLNFIRRQYYIQRIQNLRRILHLPEFVTESILVPLSYGVVPIFIRILSSIHKIDFGFQMGANIGTIFNLITFFTGVCAMRIGTSPPVDMRMFILNGIFVTLGNLLHLPLGSRKVLNLFDAACYFILFALYMGCRFFMARKTRPVPSSDSNDDLVDESVSSPKIEGVYAGFRAISDFVIKIDADKRKVDSTKIKDDGEKISADGETEIDAENDALEKQSPVMLKGKKKADRSDSSNGSGILDPTAVSIEASDLQPAFMVNKQNKEKMSETMVLFHRKINSIFLRICRKVEMISHGLPKESSNENGLSYHDSQEINIESPVDYDYFYDAQKELTLSEIVGPDQEDKLNKFIDQFSDQFVTEAKAFKFIDRKEIIEYGMKNKNLKSSLIIGWELAEIIYMNGYETPFTKKSIYENLIAFLCLPIQIFTNLTIMPHLTEEDDPLVSKMRLLFNPFFTSFFLAYIVSHGADFKSLLFLLTLFGSFAVNALIIYPVVVMDKRPTKMFFSLIYFNNVAMSLLCFFCISDIIVDLFRSLNVIYNFKYAFFTVSMFSTIVWIPAIIGAVRTTELMKIVPGYNGAIFNTLLVFGFCVLIHHILRGEITIHAWPIATDSQSDLCTVFFLLNSLVMPVTYFHLKANDFRYTRRLGVYLTAGYFGANAIVFLIGTLLVK